VKFCSLSQQETLDRLQARKRKDSKECIILHFERTRTTKSYHMGELPTAGSWTNIKIHTWFSNQQCHDIIQCHNQALAIKHQTTFGAILQFYQVIDKY